MASSLVDIPSFLEEIDLKRISLTKNILKLAVEWKDLDAHLDSTHKSSYDYEAERKDLELFRDSIAMNQRELDSVQESLGLRFKDLECREEKFYSFQLAWFEEIKMREEQTAAAKMWVVERMEELELKYERDGENEKSMEVMLEKIEIHKQDLVEIHESVGENLNAFSWKEKQCEDVCEELDLREIQVVLKEEQLEARQKVNDLRYKEYEMKGQVRSEELDSREIQVVLKEEQLEARKMMNDRRYKDMQMQVQFRWEELDSREIQVVLREEQLEARKMINDQCCKEMEMKVQVCSEELDSRENELRKERRKAIHYNEEHMKMFETKVQDLFKELDSIQEFTESRAEELDFIVKQVALKEGHFKAIQKMNEEHSNELEIKAQDRFKKLDPIRDLREGEATDLKNHNKLGIEVPDLDFSGVLKLNSERKQVKFVLKSNKKHSQTKQIEATRELLEERMKKSELKEKHTENKPEEKHCKGIQYSNEPEKKLSNGKQSHKTLLKEKQLCSKDMDGRYLQAYLNEHPNDPESLSTEVNNILLLSVDPAKLVLDAMEGFYSPHLKKGDVEFKTSVVRRSCIFLLEQLMILAPLIRPRVRERAVRLAGEWKLKMEASPNEPSMVLAFLQLVALYKLASEFDADEIFELLVYVPVEKQIPEFFRLLGLRENVFDFIRRLVEKGLHLDAIKYVCAFDVGDVFPPATLLKGYISYKERQYSLKAQETATRNELKALRAVTSTVKLHKLHFEYPLNDLIMRTEEMERAASSSVDFEGKEINEKKRKHIIPGNDAQTLTLNAQKLHRAASPELDYQPPPPIPSSHCHIGPTSGPSYTSQSDITPLRSPYHITQKLYCPMELTSGPFCMSGSTTLPLRPPSHVTSPPPHCPLSSTFVPPYMSQSGIVLPLPPPQRPLESTSGPSYMGQSGTLPFQPPPHIIPTPNYSARSTFTSSYMNQNDMLPLHPPPHLLPPHGLVGPTSAPLYMKQPNMIPLLTPPHLACLAGSGARGHANLMYCWSAAWP